MIRFFEYLKYLGLFFLFIIGIALITSLINLTGINSSFISKLGVILTALSFFIVTAIASNNTKQKGYLLGLKLGIIFIVFLIIINFILLKSAFNIDRFIYYTILLASGVLGGSFGKNFKIKKFKK